MNLTQQNTVNKSKNGQVGFNQIENFYIAKEIINSYEATHIMEEISIKCISDNGLISKIYKEHLQLNNEKI